MHRFAYCDVFTFRDDLIARVESYLVPLGGGDCPVDREAARSAAVPRTRAASGPLMAALVWA